MSNYSKYNQTGSRRIPRTPKARSIKGSGEDSGKWFRCRHCNFINSIDRSALGDGEGISYSVSTVTPEYTFNNSGAALIAGGSGRVAMINSTGKAFNERHNITPDVVSGCSMCGSKNWR